MGGINELVEGGETDLPTTLLPQGLWRKVRFALAPFFCLETVFAHFCQCNCVGKSESGRRQNWIPAWTPVSFRGEGGVVLPPACHCLLWGLHWFQWGNLRSVGEQTKHGRNLHTPYPGSHCPRGFIMEASSPQPHTAIFPRQPLTFPYRRELVPPRCLLATDTGRDGAQAACDNSKRRKIIWKIAFHLHLLYHLGFVFGSCFASSLV